jgi:hypothetical protein
MKLSNVFKSGSEYNGVHYDGENKVVKWIPIDSEEAFHNALKEDPTNPSLLHYLKNPITYKLNNYGFRTPVDFVDGIEGNVFLGCSHTFGIGNYLENTWSWKLNEYVGGNFLNLAVFGAGIGTGFRLLYQLKEIIRPKNVFLYFPHPYRFEYYVGDPPEWRSIAIHDKNFPPFLLERNNMEMYYHLHFNAIKTLCAELDVPLFAAEPFDFNDTEHKVFPDRARDTHFGPSGHISVFEKYKQLYDHKIEPSSKPCQS